MNKTTTYAGIDYGMGKSNRDKNGIRFGIIPLNDLNPDATEDIWQNGTDLDYEDYIGQVKQSLRSTLSDYFSDYKWGDEKPASLTMQLKALLTPSRMALEMPINLMATLFAWHIRGMDCTSTLTVVAMHG